MKRIALMLAALAVVPMTIGVAQVAKNKECIRIAEQQGNSGIQWLMEDKCNADLGVVMMGNVGIFVFGAFQIKKELDKG